LAERASLLVAGSTRFNPVAAALLGATGELLLKGSPCPVAVASHDLRRRAPLLLRRIGFGFDGSPHCRGGLEDACNLARAANGELHAFTVVPRRRLGSRAKHELVAAEADRRLRRALVDCGAPDATATVVVGHPSAALESAGEELDLMVVGSCGHAPLHHALTGSVSGALVRGARIPLLVVPRGTAAVATPA
jgi:nucleotide-binding universal stress UspA family protein